MEDRLKKVCALASTGWAFAALLSDGSVLTWGDPYFGGDCSEVQEKLKTVQEIHSSSYAFAAILDDGSPGLEKHC